MFGVLSDGTRKIDWVRFPTGLFPISSYLHSELDKGQRVRDTL